MQDSTTVRVSIETRNEIRQLADADGLTIDQELRALARAERQRRMGAALANTPPSTQDHPIFEGYATAVQADGTW